MVAQLEALFPSLRGTSYRITSARDDSYNCVAWAAGVTTICWWPTDPEGFWPEAAPHLETIDAFRGAFATLGYSECTAEQHEPGVEKIALFAAASGMPTHAARQLSTGLWTSKLGLLEDIEHELHALEGKEYGQVALLMKRTSHAAQQPLSS